MDHLNLSAKFDVRSFTHSWDNRGYFKNLGSPCIRPRSLFSQIFKGLLFAWTLWIYLTSLKFTALPVPEIIGGTQKIGAVPGYAHAPFSPKILKGFCSHDPVNIPAKFEVRSFIRSWDNRGYSNNLGSPCIPTLHFFPNFWSAFVRMDHLNISAKFDVRSFTHSWDNRGYFKNWGVSGFAHPLYSPKFLKAFCSHGPCEYTCQVWSS